MKSKVLLVLIIGFALVMVSSQVWADKARVIHLENATLWGDRHGQITIHPRANAVDLEYLNLNTHNLIGQDDAFYALYLTFLDNPTEKIRIFYFNPSPMMIGYSVAWVDVGGIPGLFTRDILFEIAYELDDGIPGTLVLLSGVDYAE